MNVWGAGTDEIRNEGRLWDCKFQYLNDLGRVWDSERYPVSLRKITC